jgi:NADP-dependent 3-hydroxy acid dehydrogenase YdfG
MDEMIRLNVGALTRLTYAAAPGFVARGGGTIVNIASSVAVSPETLNGVYGNTKAFTNSRRRECVSKRFCPERRRRSSGTRPGYRCAIYPRKL